MTQSAQNQQINENSQFQDDDFLDDLELDEDFDDEDFDDEGFDDEGFDDEELDEIGNNAMMLGDFIESIHEKLYADHRLSEVIELFATVTSVVKKYGDPFENQQVIERALSENYTAEEINEFVDIMQAFQELGQEYGLTSLDGSVFKLQNISDDLLEDLFAEAAEIAEEELEDEDFDSDDELFDDEDDDDFDDEDDDDLDDLDDELFDDDDLFDDEDDDLDEDMPVRAAV